MLGAGAGPAREVGRMRVCKGVQEPGWMVEELVRKLSGFFSVREGTAEDLVKLCSEVRSFAPKERIASSGDAYRGIYLVSNGWALRSRVLENGARQIVNVAMAGDFLGLNAMIFEHSDFDIVAKTHLTAYFVERDVLRGVLGRDPELAAAIFWVSAHEESILAERIVSLGRRSVRVRTAHVLCEFISRLEIIDGDHGNEMLIPLTQEDFADILGTSLVHTNKTLRSLDRDGIIQFRQGLLRVIDRRQLERTAGFERGYLHFTRVRPPRAAAPGD
jgi:CRP-like cAMP-binding protein